MTLPTVVLAIAVATVVALIPPPALPHSGGTDRQGCHVESRTGLRHCHNPKSDSDADKVVPVLVVIGVIAAIVVIPRWMDRRQGSTANLIPAPQDEPWLRLGLVVEDETPTIQAMWRF